MCSEPVVGVVGSRTARLLLVTAAWLAGPIVEVRAGLEVQINGSFSVPAPAPVDRSSPSWPWSWLGVTTTMTAAPGPVSGAIHGSSNFAFPSVVPGTLVVPIVDFGPIAYGTAFDTASIGGSASFSGKLNFHYNIAGKSGDPLLATFGVSSAPSGTMTDGAHLTVGTAAATLHDHHNGLSFGIDFPGKPFNLVGASASLDADINQTHKLDWTPAVRYGYYVWANASGSLSAADSLTFVDAADGSPLSMKFPPPPLGASTYFASFLPAVKVRIDIAQNVAPQGDLIGSLHAYAPGWSKDYSFPPLASLKLTPAASSLTYEAEFDGIQYQSVPLAGGPNQFLVTDLPTFRHNDFLGGGQSTTGVIGVPGSFVDVQGFNVGVPNPEPVVIDNTAYSPDDPALGVAIFRLAPTSWAAAVSGSWSTAGNWTGDVPNAVGKVAVINAATTAALTITLDGPRTVGALQFGNSGSAILGYTLSGSGNNTLTLNNSGGGAIITVTDGKHVIDAPVVLADNFMVSGSGTLAFGNSSSITDNDSGYSLTMSGTGGTLILGGSNTYTGGTIVSTGTLEIASAEALPAGRSLTIGAGGTVVLSSGLTDAAASNAATSATAVPEPGTIALLAAGLAGLLVVAWRRRR